MSGPAAGSGSAGGTGPDARPAPSPWALMWRRFTHHRLGVIGGITLIVQSIHTGDFDIEKFETGFAGIVGGLAILGFRRNQSDNPDGNDE